MPKKEKIIIVTIALAITSMLLLSVIKEQTNVYALNFAEETILGGSNQDVARGVAVWGTKHVIVGYTNSFGAGGYDAFIAVKDGSITSMWTFGTSNDDYAFAVAVYGNYAYIVGSTRNPSTHHDIFVVIWDLANPGIVAQIAIASPYADRAFGVTVGVNYVFVTGQFNEKETFLAILDAAYLNLLHFVRLDAGLDYEFGYGIDYYWTGSQYIIIIGGSTRSVTFGGHDASILRIDWDPAGTPGLVWSLRFGTSADDVIQAVKFTSSTTFVVAGVSNNNGFIASFTIDGGVIAGKATVFSTSSRINSIAYDGTYLYAAGHFSNPPKADDALILRINATNLDLRGAKGYGKATIDRAHGIAVSDSNIVVVGETSTSNNDVFTPSFDFEWIQWNPIIIPPSYTPFMRTGSVPYVATLFTLSPYNPFFTSASQNIVSGDGEAFYVRFTS
jgi:hypothetical protein